MARCQRNKLIALGQEKYIGADHEPANSQLGQACVGLIKILWSAGTYELKM